jgi:hypothetical protein
MAMTNHRQNQFRGMKYPAIVYDEKHMIIAADLSRARGKIKLLLGLLLPVFLLLVSCGQEAPPEEQRLIILGFDGMDPALARQWMLDESQGQLSG